MTTIEQEVLKYVHLNLQEDLSLNTLSKFTGYSEYHLHRILKKSIGEPIGQYIKRKRIENAAMMLGITNYPVSKVSELSGYEDYTAFSRAFTQEMGTSVKNFKKNTIVRKEEIIELPFSVDYNYRIEKLPDLYLFSFPTFCDYFTEEFYDVWKTLDLNTYKNTYGDIKTYWSVLHECPNITKKKRCRMDMALEFNVDPQQLNKIPTTVYKGGKYIVLNVNIEHKYSAEFCLHMEQYLLQNTDLEFKDGYSFFKYKTDPTQANIDHHEIEWYMAIE